MTTRMDHITHGDVPKVTRRLGMVVVRASFLLDLLKTRPITTLACDGVPADAKPVRLGYDALHDTIVAVFEHPSFPECPEGSIPHELYPRFSTYTSKKIDQVLRECGWMR